jgi:ribosomal protein S18 acetylase RimI-like enzyme
VSPSDVTLRRATRADLEAVGRLGALLMQTHFDFDRLRFLAPAADASEGYAWFLGTQISRDDASVIVAERDGVVIGYVYAAVEPLSWKELRDEAGFIHDVYVDEAARGAGVARALVDAALAWLRERGMPRVLLWTAAPNAAAQRLFEGVGFRHTMRELTLEL